MTMNSARTFLADRLDAISARELLNDEPLIGGVLDRLPTLGDVVRPGGRRQAEAAPSGLAAIDEIDAIISRDEVPPVDLLSRFMREDPNGYAEIFGADSPEDVARSFSEQFGVTAPEATDRADLAKMSRTDVLQMAIDELIKEFAQPGANRSRAIIADELANSITLLGAMRDLEEGSVTLADGTLITSEMLNHRDPALRQQYRNAYQQRERQVDEEWRGIANQYALDQYVIDTDAVDRDNALEISRTNAQLNSIRERLARDEINITRAAEEADRVLRGMTEARGRADLEATAAQDARPWASGGKTAFSPNDVGLGALAKMVGVPQGDAAIRYPGSVTVDPRSAIAYHDRLGNVEGGTQPIPGLSVSDADMPRATSLRGYEGINVPRLAPPGQIRMPWEPSLPRYNEG